MRNQVFEQIMDRAKKALTTDSDVQKAFTLGMALAAHQLKFIDSTQYFCVKVLLKTPGLDEEIEREPEPEEEKEITKR